MIFRGGKQSGELTHFGGREDYVGTYADNKSRHDEASERSAEAAAAAADIVGVEGIENFDIGIGVEPTAQFRTLIALI